MHPHPFTPFAILLMEFPRSLGILVVPIPSGSGKLSSLQHHPVPFPRSSTLFNISTTWVNLWFVADCRWDEGSGAKVLKPKLDSVMALVDKSYLLALKAISNGEFSSTFIAVQSQ